MKKISEKSITDLEFDIVLQQAAEHCATDFGKKALLDLRPYTSLSRVQIEIERVNEYNSSYASEHNIPNHGFESIDKALELLSIENSKIEIESFQHIAHLAKTAQTLLRFLKKQNSFFHNFTSLDKKFRLKNRYQKKSIASLIVLERFAMMRLIH